MQHAGDNLGHLPVLQALVRTEIILREERLILVLSGQRAREDGEVERDEEPQRCGEHSWLGRPCGDKPDKQRRKEQARSVCADRVGFIATEDLVSNLANTASCLSLLDMGHWKECDVPKQMQW